MSHPLKTFAQFVAIHIVKGFNVVKEAVDIFVEFSCFFYDPADVDNLTSGSSVFSGQYGYSIFNFLRNC